MLNKQYYVEKAKVDRLVARKNIYYASCDTRMHVATTTIDKLEDYLFNTPQDLHRSPYCVKQRCGLISKNLELLKNEK